MKIAGLGDLGGDFWGVADIGGMANSIKFLSDIDLSGLDTGSLTNTLNDIDSRLPRLADAADLSQMLQVKDIFERELRQPRRLH